MLFVAFPILCGKFGLIFLSFDALCVLKLCSVGELSLWSSVHLHSPAWVPIAGVDGERKVSWVSTVLSGFLSVFVLLRMSVSLSIIVSLWGLFSLSFCSFGYGVLWLLCICCGVSVSCRVFVFF